MIKRKSYLKRGGVRRGLKRPQAKKKTRNGNWGAQAELKRSWGIPASYTLRYTGLKGIYWYWFSKTIRDRDYRDFDGLCMTCLEPVEKGSDQCGHLFPARDCGFALLFHSRNNHLQHSKCNNPRFTPGAGVLNAMNIENRYGRGTLNELAKLKRTPNQKEWSKKEYEHNIKELLAYKKSLQ